MSRRTKTLVLTSSPLLCPPVVEVCKSRSDRKGRKPRATTTGQVLPPLEVGQEVWAAPLQKYQSWKTEVCTEKLSDRSYLVKTGNGVGHNEFISRVPHYVLEYIEFWSDDITKRILLKLFNCLEQPIWKCSHAKWLFSALNTEIIYGLLKFLHTELSYMYLVLNPVVRIQW